MERRQRRIFPESFKREAVDRVATSGLSVSGVAAELGLHETVLRRWMMQFGAQATGTPRRPDTQAAAQGTYLAPSDLVADNARLRREHDRLRMERDILKKAALIFGAASR
jgi:transposase